MERTLKTGRKVVVRESSGLDDLISYQLIGDNFDENNLFGASLLQKSILTVLCIESIDDEPVTPPEDLVGVYAFLKQFKSSEWNEIQALFREVNTPDLKSLTESQTTPSSDKT